MLEAQVTGSKLESLVDTAVRSLKIFIIPVS